jgi:hypothetical protein
VLPHLVLELELLTKCRYWIRRRGSLNRVRRFSNNLVLFKQQSRVHHCLSQEILSLSQSIRLQLQSLQTNRRTRHRNAFQADWKSRPYCLHSRRQTRHYPSPRSHVRVYLTSRTSTIRRPSTRGEGRIEIPESRTDEFDCAYKWTCC